MSKEELLYQIATLQQENKQLKEQMQNTYETSQDLLSEMQMKIDKAIEYIKNLECLHIGLGESEDDLQELYASTKDYAKDLLKILRGNSNA